MQEVLGWELVRCCGERVHNLSCWDIPGHRWSEWVHTVWYGKVQRGNWSNYRVYVQHMQRGWDEQPAGIARVRLVCNMRRRHGDGSNRGDRGNHHRRRNWVRCSCFLPCRIQYYHVRSGHSRGCAGGRGRGRGRAQLCRRGWGRGRDFLSGVQVFSRVISHSYSRGKWSWGNINGIWRFRW